MNIMGNGSAIYKSVIFFLSTRTWHWYNIPFKRDVRALKYLIEIELGSEIVDINYSGRARLKRPTSTVSSS